MQQGRKSNRYQLARVPSCAGVVRYELTKPDGTVYTTQVVPFTSVGVCDCPARGRCLHLDAVRTIAEEGGDELETVRDLDAEAEMMDTYYAGAM